MNGWGIFLPLHLKHNIGDVRFGNLVPLIREQWFNMVSVVCGNLSSGTLVHMPQGGFMPQRGVCGINQLITQGYWLSRASRCRRWHQLGANPKLGTES